MTKAIIFDMGGVMLQNRVEVVYKRLAKSLGVKFDSFKELQKQHKKEMLNGKPDLQLRGY